jgi:hypothetical protein
LKPPGVVALKKDNVDEQKAVLALHPPLAFVVVRGLEAGAREDDAVDGVVLLPQLARPRHRLRGPAPYRTGRGFTM